jgi:hypothetical protein
MRAAEAELRLIRRLRVHLLHDRVARPVRLDRDTLGEWIDDSIPQIEHDVDRRVGVAAAGMQLVAVLADLPMIPETVGDAGCVE